MKSLIGKKRTLVGVEQRSKYGWPEKVFVFVMPAIWLTIFSQMENAIEVLANNYPFFFLGIFGAIAANSTGAGGGIVFIPAFSQLGITPEHAVGTSIGIQCFGMTAGSIAWFRHYLRDRRENREQWLLFPDLLKIAIIPAIAGMLLCQNLPLVAPGSVQWIFSVLSITFGVTVLFSTILFERSAATCNSQLSKTDIILLPLVSFFGGVVTAWVSVGIGEFVAVYLILRRHSVLMAVAVAVCLSSITVLSGFLHEIQSRNVNWDIILFAAPAAILGGILARKLACYINVKWLKVMIGLWIVCVGLVK